MADGHATLLARELDGLTTRKGGASADDLAKRVKAARDAAEAALSASVREEVARLAAEHKARRAGR